MSISSHKFLALAFVIATVFSGAIAVSGVTIEPYQSERDYPAVKAILEADSQDLLYPDQPLEYTAKYLASDNYKTDVIRIDDITVGFINYCVYDVKLLWIFNWDRKELLHLVGIDINHRRQGYAKQLIQHALEYGRQDGAQSAFLMTKPGNDAARKLYEDLGFACTNLFTVVSYTLQL